MNPRIAALLALMIFVPGAAITANDFRAGTSRFWFLGAVNPLTANRTTNPAFFWAFTAVNVVLLALLISACVALAVIG